MSNSDISTGIALKIRLRQLRCFVTVARKKSFVMAAEELGLTQPAVSRSVRELEQILGHQLFDRSSRGAELTLRGRVFLESAQAGLLQISQGANLAFGKANIDQSVRIGALPNVCSRYLPNIISAYKSEYPDVRIRIQPGTNIGLLDSLRRGETDFVIGRLSTSEDMKGLLFEALYDEPLVFVVRQSHPILRVQDHFSDALLYPLVLPPEGTIIRQETARFLSTKSVTKLSNLIETTSSDFQRAYLKATDCVAVIPRGVVQSELDQGIFVELDIHSEMLNGPVGLTSNPKQDLGESAMQLMQYIREKN